MPARSIDELLDELGRPDPEYAAKQLHPVPDAPVICRETFILEKCLGKTVLDIGASGPMHAAIEQVAGACYGIDRLNGPGVVGFNIDATHGTPPLPQFEDIDVVICGEVIEHLANPGFFLERLRRQYPVPVVITVPNAATLGISRLLSTGVENVNIDHVAWYSYRTLRTLLERYGYAISEFAWYNGKPRTAEGLIVVAE